MSNLTPEVHINKHGFPVTKHVRSSYVYTSKKSVPRPVVTPEVPAAMAALDLICSRDPKPDDRRSFLIREIGNTGMDDDDAVNFLALVYMPQELLEETDRFIKQHPDSSVHRQEFFRFANDAYFELPNDEATVLVANGIRATPEGFQFSGIMKERLDLMSQHGIDASKPMSGTDLLAAQSIIAVLESALVSEDEAERYLQTSETETLQYAGITDRDLANVVLRSGENYPALVKIIQERNTVDPDFLSSFLDHPTPAVKEGTL